MYGNRRERVQESLAALAEQSRAAAQGELGALDEVDSGDLTPSQPSAVTSPGSSVHGATSGQICWTAVAAAMRFAAAAHGKDSLFHGQLLQCAWRPHDKACSKFQKSHASPFGTILHLFRMLSPGSVQQSLVRTSLQLLIRISEGWLAVDSELHKA